MTLLWTLLALFLYFEMFLCLILILPILSPTRWRSIFKSRLIKFIVSYANFYFILFLGLLCIMLIDAIRDMRKYSGSLSDDDMKNSPLAETHQHMKLFRAQRNFYIAGFAVFLFVMLRRLVVLINDSAKLAAESEASHKQATSASQAAKQMLDQKSDFATLKSVKDLEGKLKEAQQALQESTKELKESKLQQETLKKQADNNNKEYDRLLKELSTVQGKLEAVEGRSQGKKSD